ncbi:YigZ family protein [Streptococcus bovimastitidis]|uniref:YigZ family protein n=1 Tax=Streptococcus bovimastitidis TaxID=1856638 RepID=A0A1L8ML81_9STRE|nr:YigZ family protein [Streptococcus bovimastitidis]OJF71481.1 YigZ family protein [Streptococcus bovimastitidis]
MESYKTIEQNGQHEEIIKKSRFICQAFRIESEEEGREIIARIKKEHYKANHSCSAMIIGEKAQIKRSSDDGEPSGTAGVPMLSVLEKQELTNILLVVTRYFGGIKLGTGGLIRAYSSAVSSCLEHVQIVEVKEQVGIRLELSYSQYQTFPNFLEAFGLIEHNPEFTDKVSTSLYCDGDFQKELLEQLTQHYQGKLAYQKINPKVIEVPVPKP